MRKKLCVATIALITLAACGSDKNAVNVFDPEQITPHVTQEDPPGDQPPVQPASEGQDNYTVEYSVTVQEMGCHEVGGSEVFHNLNHGFVKVLNPDGMFPLAEGRLDGGTEMPNGVCKFKATISTPHSVSGQYSLVIMGVSKLSSGFPIDPPTWNESQVTSSLAISSSLY
jgi:hypothetical protein